jgi:hypothetical protein
MRDKIESRVEHVGDSAASKATFFLAAWALTWSLLIGGGNANFYLTNALLQLLTLPTLIVVLWSSWERAPPPEARPLLYLLAAWFVLLLFQLIPLPPAIWTNLPFRDKAVAAYAIFGEAGRWAPLSLAPERTIVGALTNIPPLAVFLGTLSLGFRERRLLTLIALAFGLINAFVGLLQLSQGPDSSLYLFRNGGHGDSEGLFSNRNHEAALLYGVTPLAAAWIGALAPALSERGPDRKFQTARLIKMIAAVVTLIVLIVAELMTRSRSGVILLMCALFGAFSLQPWRTLRDRGAHAGGIFAASTILALAFGLQYGLYRILERFEADPFEDARVAFGRTTAQAAMKALPLGTGLGSFARIYAMLEKPSDLMRDRYANVADNDPLQLILETGAPGAVLLLVFFIWYLWRCWDIWRNESSEATASGIKYPHQGARIDLVLARAATLSIALLLAHSIVDAPLRTSALLSFFGLCCALLVPPMGQSYGSPNLVRPSETREE